MKRKGLATRLREFADSNTCAIASTEFGMHLDKDIRRAANAVVRDNKRKRAQKIEDVHDQTIQAVREHLREIVVDHSANFIVDMAKAAANKYTALMRAFDAQRKEFKTYKNKVENKLWFHEVLLKRVTQLADENAKLWAAVKELTPPGTIKNDEESMQRQQGDEVCAHCSLSFAYVAAHGDDRCLRNEEGSHLFLPSSELSNRPSIG